MGKSGIGWTAMLAIAAMGSAQAVNLDINGRGQVLLYPYYTVNKGQQTLLSVTNTATLAQADVSDQAFLYRPRAHWR